jgi:hypothetical protein
VHIVIPLVIGLAVTVLVAFSSHSAGRLDPPWTRVD